MPVSSKLFSQPAEDFSKTADGSVSPGSAICLSDSLPDSASRGRAWGRRDFVTGVLSAFGAASLWPLRGVAENIFRGENAGLAKSAAGGGMTAADGTGASAGGAMMQGMSIRQVIDLILKEVPGAPFKQTVDTIKSGNADQPVKGIVSTMFATDAVIDETIRLGANFIIAHEPTFYNHLDETDWLAGDKVFQYKKDKLEKNGIVVWRFHDHWHAHRPDGVLMGVLVSMGWDKYYDPAKPHILTIPSTSLGDIVKQAKKGMGIEKIKAIGELSQSCTRILIMPGAAGGRAQIQGIRDTDPDLLICGELNEWETSEYIRDLRYQGGKTALLDLGHSVSEEPGMVWLVSWLEPKVKGIKVTHIASGEAFRFV